MLSKLMDVLAKMPSTNARIAMTLVIALGTAIKYWASGSWEPSVEWLAFMVTMAGIDALQYHGKRRTFKTPKEMNGG
jgi:hypothetical protein